MRLKLLLASVLLCAGCGGAGEPGLKAIVGGRLEPSLDAEPIPYSVVVIANGKIRAAGPQASTPVPKGAETIDAKGKVIQPMPYTGKVAPGEPADLLIRDAASFAPERLMREGQWVQ
jgi:cytosine/adenosine deaminase-related metal-dependent hydrolase